jgi:7-cyano-7-deazaguanine synthase
VIELDPRAFQGSALTGSGEVPHGTPPAGASPSRAGVPVTYVPARNTILLAFALGWAEVLGAREIWIGVTAVDYSGYPDCRPEYIEAFDRMAALATKSGVEGHPISVRAPLLNLSKAEIIRRGIELGVDYSLTHSCYDPRPGGLACGSCDSCHHRRKGFEDAGIADPTCYG